MPATYSTNAHLALQATGEDSGTWGDNLNADVFTIIDGILGNVQTVSLASTDVTLTTSQTQVATIKLTGTLTANVNVIFPAIGRVFFVQNSTTGAFNVTLKIAGSGATAIAPPNSLSGQFFVLDGTNVYADFGGTPVGKVDMFAMSAVPYGWFICDGSAKSRTTYAALFAAIGTTYGSGDGSTTFNLPDARGYFARAWDDGAGRDPGRVIGTTQTQSIQSHTHGITDPGHAHNIDIIQNLTGTNNGNQPRNAGTGTGSIVSETSRTGITVQNTGGTETRPINIAFAFAIKW
jgi:microcystin-dependent protein